MIALLAALPLVTLAEVTLDTIGRQAGVNPGVCDSPRGGNYTPGERPET